jgi:pimeloyl-ACP methyl ester carboxylesterase
MLWPKRALASLLRGLVLLALAVTPAACDEQAASPAPPPSPSPQPSPTPSLQQALDRSMFTISFNGALLATEEIRVDTSGNQPVVFSEIKRSFPLSMVERRTVVLSPNYGPLQYELERVAFGVRSTWATEVTDGATNGLGNNADWYGPVLLEGVTPPPDVMLDSAPSALPFALLALRYTTTVAQTKTAPEPLRLTTMDVIEGLAVTRPLTITTAPDRKGAVIGTSAIEGHIGGGSNPRFTLWIRPGSRTLYSAEVPDYVFDPWQGRTHPVLHARGRLVIQRVSRMPEPATPQPSDAQHLDVGFAGADKASRSGTLILPPGSGPFPVLVVHSDSGVRPRAHMGDVFAQQGWAVYSYDKRGLGESEGEFERGPGRGQVEDAIAAAAMLAQRPEIDARRIVFMGLGDGGLVGAQVMARESGYAGAILGSCATATRIFPDLAQERSRTVLAAHYGWTNDQIELHANQSTNRWEAWLVEGRDEIESARRRVSVVSLRDWANIDLPAALATARGPVLLLHGEEDRWTPVAGARTLYERLQAQNKTQIAMEVFPGLDDSLVSDAVQDTLAPPVQEAILAWLKALG